MVCGTILDMRKIETNIFMDNAISVRVLLPLSRKTITTYNVAVFMMQNKTVKYPTKAQLLQAVNEAYSLQASIRLTGMGNLLCLDYRFKYLNARYLPSGLTDCYIDLMDQILFHPLLDEDGFMEAKRMLEDRLLRMEDDPDTLALTTSLSELDTDHSASVRMSGYLEDLKTISLEDVRLIVDQIHNQPKYIYTCGKIEKEIEIYLNQFSASSMPAFDSALYPQHAMRQKKIQREIDQTSLAWIYATKIGYDSPNYYAQVLANEMLGQCQVNLLYQNIREKQGLCYSIGSSMIHFDGLLLITAGIQKEDCEQVLSLIKEQIECLQKGKFSKDLMELSKKDWIATLLKNQDRPFARINRAFYDDLLHRSSSLEQRIEKIQAIQVEDIVKVSSQWKPVSLALVEEF